LSCLRAAIQRISTLGKNLVHTFILGVPS
jgi:hypothetical protein